MYSKRMVKSPLVQPLAFRKVRVRHPGLIQIQLPCENGMVSETSACSQTRHNASTSVLFAIADCNKALNVKRTFEFGGSSEVTFFTY